MAGGVFATATAGRFVGKAKEKERERKREGERDREGERNENRARSSDLGGEKVEGRKWKDTTRRGPATK